MDLYSETGIGHLVFEQAERIRDLEETTERYREAIALCTWMVENTCPYPFVPQLQVVDYLDEIGRRGEVGAEPWWMPEVRLLMGRAADGGAA